jgi:hypothetical protein
MNQALAILLITVKPTHQSKLRIKISGSASGGISHRIGNEENRTPDS